MDRTNLFLAGVILCLTFYAGGEFREYQLRSEAKAFASALMERMVK